jgi:hypothetical protein
MGAKILTTSKGLVALLNISIFKILQFIYLFRYALTVQDNQNLQLLWPKTQNLTIHNKMLFHFNPKLCLNSIEELVNSSTVPGTLAFKHSDVDISP